MMDPLILTIGGGLVTAICYLYHRQERAQERCEKREESLAARIDKLEEERGVVLVELTSAIKEMSDNLKTQRVERAREFSPHTLDHA